MLTQSQSSQQSVRRVKPSRVDPLTAEPFTLQQQLEPFGTWVGPSLWVPPKDSSTTLAESMLRQSSPFTSRQKSWSSVVEQHRSTFTQVREISLTKASLRLPQGKLFVTVCEQDRFHEITDPIPACVQTRLDEFLSGPGKQRGVKVYYLKPLCVEVGDDLILTSREDLLNAISVIQNEVFAAYRRRYLSDRAARIMLGAVNFGLMIPRALWKYRAQRRQRAVDEYQARLEFERRKIALRATKTHQRLRTTGCTFDQMLELTNPLKRLDVIEQYAIENDLSVARRNQLIGLAAGAVPWFVSLALTATWLAKVSMALSTLATLAPPVLVCDPAFVAEMPDAPGTLLKIGHFDKIGGIMHVEI